MDAMIKSWHDEREGHDGGEIVERMTRSSAFEFSKKTQWRGPDAMMRA